MSQSCKNFTRPSPTIYILRKQDYNLIIESSYQTHSNNIYFKLTGLVKDFQEGEIVLKQDTLLLYNP